MCEMDYNWALIYAIDDDPWSHPTVLPRLLRRRPRQLQRQWSFRSPSKLPFLLLPSVSMLLFQSASWLMYV